MNDTWYLLLFFVFLSLSDQEPQEAGKCRCDRRQHWNDGETVSFLFRFIRAVRRCRRLADDLRRCMNETGSTLARPSRIIAISPGSCPCSEEERKRMYELDAKDVAISAKYMITAEEIMRHGSVVPEYMIHLQNGNFQNCPPVTMIYGTEEVLYAIAPSFEKAFEKYNVNYTLIKGEGMFHCYPVFPICREAKEGWNLMIALLREN